MQTNTKRRDLEVQRLDHFTRSEMKKSKGATEKNEYQVYHEDRNRTEI